MTVAAMPMSVPTYRPFPTAARPATQPATVCFDDSGRSRVCGGLDCACWSAYTREEAVALKARLHAWTDPIVARFQSVG